MVKNQFNINDIVRIKNFTEHYRIVRINLDTLSDKCKTIWYQLYRLSDGYVCIKKENGIEIVSQY